MANYTLIGFPNSEYTIPEIVEKAAENYDIVIKEDNLKAGKKLKSKVKNQTYRTMYQHFKRKLDSAILDETGNSPQATGRKTTFPRDIVDKVINSEEIRDWLLSKADEETQAKFKEYDRVATEYSAGYDARMDASLEAEIEWRRKKLDTYDISDNIKQAIKEKKKDIVTEIIFKYFVDLDEDLLESDFRINMTMDKKSIDADTVAANERLLKNSSYYKLKSKKLVDLLS